MAFHQDFPISFDEALKTAKTLLSRSPELVEKGVIDTEAEQIVIAAYRTLSGHDLRRSELYARMRDALPAPAGEKVVLWAMARAEGGLLQHLLGFQTFLDHEYEVGPEVLVPRPETEVLATFALATLEAQSQAPALGYEIGLGSGVLSIELLSRFPSLTMIASELKPEAARRAQKNAQRILGPGPNGSSRLRIRPVESAGQVFEAMPAPSGPGDFVISNPPYLIAADPVDAEVTRHEPHSALFAPEADPIFFYRKIAEQAPAFLKKGAWAFLEIPPERADLISDILKQYGWKPEVLQDLTRRSRVIRAQFL